MGILQELAKRAALKTKNMQMEIPTAAEQVTHLPTVRQSSPLAEAAKVIATKPKLTTPPAYVPEGLESPTRRKILKQAVASAVRASVPDQIAQPLMKMATKEILTPQVNPELLGASLKDLIFEGNMGDELYDIGSGDVYGDIIKSFIAKSFPKEHLSHLDSAFPKLRQLADHEFTYEIPQGGADTHTMDLGYDIFSGDLPRMFDNIFEENNYDEALQPLILEKIKELGFTPEEVQAIRKLDETMPRSMEEMDILIDPKTVPYDLSPKELQKWIFDQEGNWRNAVD